VKTVRIAFLTLATPSLVFAAHRVSADHVEERRSMVVGYGDLDLSRAEGPYVLYKRFQHAARQVCKTRDGGYGDPAVWLHCRHDALARAIRDLNDPRVTALYIEERPRETAAAIATVMSSSTR